MPTRLPGTAERIPLHTAQQFNDRIVERTLSDVALYQHASPELRDARIHQLDREWDTERVLETSHGALLIAIGVLGLLAPRRWLAVAAGLIGGFLLQHALQGWSPQVPLVRRVGVRTPYEIAGEKSALMR